VDLNIWTFSGVQFCVVDNLTVAIYSSCRGNIIYINVTYVFCVLKLLINWAYSTVLVASNSVS